MAYIKLNEVELVTSSVEPNFLIEEDGEIKRISASDIVSPRTQANWDETDPTSPAFILNKPGSLGSGNSGGKVVTYTFGSGSGLCIEGNPVTAQEVLDEWNAGSTLRFAISDTNQSNVFNVSYTMDSGVLSSLTIKYLDSAGTVQSKHI